MSGFHSQSSSVISTTSGLDSGSIELDSNSTTTTTAASSVSGYNPWAGHLGYLTSAQEESLDKFKKLLQEARLYVPASTKDGEEKEASHDDPTLLRFLRARRFDPSKALKQFSDTEAWRKKYDVDKLYAEFEMEEFESSKRYYPRWTGRRDKGGRPVYVYRLSSIEPFTKEIHAVSDERRYQRIIVLYELMVRFVAPLCSYAPHSDGRNLSEKPSISQLSTNGDASAPTLNETANMNGTTAAQQDSSSSSSAHPDSHGYGTGPPITSTVSIIDLANISLSSLWSLRSHLQEASKLANANYPETLHAIVVVNVPGWWGKIWGLVKNWFDEYTRNKIHILSAEQCRSTDPQKNTIFALIDKENVPKQYGGTLEWEFEDEPKFEDMDVSDRTVNEEANGGQKTTSSEGVAHVLKKEWEASPKTAKKEEWNGGMPRGPWVFDLSAKKVDGERVRKLI
ncbi:hypothetical protein D9758_013604 [Tetrapyrgos nigripes]|uniref:CRAL-TRIO domain-containing protein n=1 Tax=Tetrapyrgos nigripes TaxID=182062 RepID=A0A8H5FI68_9AGAR|nr:hypothetical protein D9758_013604 [Tetrapyrgos nigripes]